MNLELHKKYPYEGYCKTCNEAICYLSTAPKAGDAMRALGAINLDGSAINPGDRVVCKCPPDTGRVFWYRGKTTKQTK